VILVVGILASGAPIRPRFFFALLGFVLIAVVRGAVVVGKGVVGKGVVGEGVVGAGVVSAAKRSQGERIGTILATLLIVLSLASLPFGYRYPKQDFDGAVQYLHEHQQSGEPVGTGGLATYPLERFYGVDSARIHNIDEFRSMQVSGKPLWLVYSFPEYMDAGVVAAAGHCPVQIEFPGTHLMNSKLERWETLLFLGVPALILIGSYIGICIETGLLWPGNAMVHESGGRTLIETVFWLEHGVREIPIDVLFGLAIAGVLLRFCPTENIVVPPQTRTMWLSGCLLGLLTGFIVVGAAMKSGIGVVIEEFAQMHTRPGTPPVWGSHWDSHLLSRGALILSALAVGGVHAALAGAASNSRQIGIRSFTISAAVFVAVTVLLGPNLRPFLDAVLIGHQARELATHLLVTLPLSFGVGLFVVRSRFGKGDRAGGTKTFSFGAVPSASWMAIAGVGVIGVYLTAGFLITAAYGQGQSSNMTSLVLVHFFEHGLSYVFTPLWVALLCAWMGGSSAEPGDQL
jgi:hypothetical protein